MNSLDSLALLASHALNEAVFQRHAERFPDARNPKIPCAERERRNAAYLAYTKKPHPSTLGHS